MANPFLAMVARPFKQRGNNKKLNQQSAEGVYEKKFLRINGFEQYVTIRGCHKENPVLLIIHGGPGSSYTPFNVWLLEWEKYFTIVQWDQAGSGKTFKKNGTSQKITFDILAKDGIALTNYMLDYLKKDKLLLVGSSVGSLVALKMIKQEPGLFAAYVGTDQNSPGGIDDAYRQITKNTENCKDTKSTKFLKAIGENRHNWTIEQYGKLMKVGIANCKTAPNMVYDLMLPAIMYDADYSMQDIKLMDQGMKYAMEQIYKELLTFDFDQLGIEFNVPIYVFQGKDDCITPYVSAEKYFQEIISPKKKFVPISNAGHLAMFCNPTQFLQELLKINLKTMIGNT
ncbi:MAG TPA: alpha/beta hydrolase [Cytophagaceae bacterium]|jgi:pimeloyl-ACP methyl ester carboxylesterase